MNGVDFVKGIETKLIKYDIPKEVFYAESGVSTANMSQWRTGKFNPSPKAVEKVNMFFDKYKKEKAPSEVGERNDDPDMYRIERARKNMSSADKQKMMRILEASFEDFFSEDYKDSDLNE